MRARFSFLAVLLVALLAPVGVDAQAPDHASADGEPPGTIGRERAEEASGGRLPELPDDPVEAGVAAVDATWHVGASAGQYASDGTPIGVHPDDAGPEALEGAETDPYAHSTRRASSYGLESRSSARALVVEGSDGARAAFVSNDLYIPQDLVNRRVGTILEERDLRIALGLDSGHLTGVTEDNMAVSVSHSHSSAYYSTPSWGVWLFQDVFDVRYFEYIAQRMAEAVIEATADMRPVRMGGAVAPFDRTQRHSYGPQIADAGTPAGYPETDNDKTVSIIRFDDITEPQNPRPFATWVIFGLHPEMLDGNDLVTGEWVTAMMRMVDRTLGGGHVTLFSQKNIGTSEPAREARAHPPEARAEFSHKEYAQMTRAGRLLADTVLEARVDIERDEPEVATERVPFSSSFEVGVKDLRLAPPSLRFLPSVSNCRAEQLFDGNPPVPLAGLPDCEHPLEGANEMLPFDPGVTYDLLREAGVPVPDNIPVPPYTGLQETLQVHLQAFRLGDIAVTICPCEQFADQSRNIRSRLQRGVADLWLGFDWTQQLIPSDRGDGRAGQPWCEQNGDGTWTCGNPRTGGYSDLEPVSDLSYRRMVAQVNNDACNHKGCWDELLNSVAAESDPADPADIWGNYIHERIPDEHRYDMVVPVGMANDYWGYIVTYREFQAHDHYRKSLTGLGPHSSDFFATRLTRMAAELNGGDPVEPGPKDLLYMPENVHQRERARWIGEAAEAYLPAYEATQPADGGTPQITAQPTGIERFDAARVSWIGGSNWFDLPEVTVERRVDGEWEPYGDSSMEVQYLVDFPDTDPQELLRWRSGEYEWEWTATFEAYSSDIDLVDLGHRVHRATPPGTYRFVVSGRRHDGLGAVSDYELASDPFQVSPWTGLEVVGLTADAATDTVSFSVTGVDTPGSSAGPIDYPDSYDSPFPFVEAGKDFVSYPGGHVEEFCFHCTFEAWADAGVPAAATVVVDGVDVPASCGADGTCTAAVVLDGTETVEVEAGAVIDEFGNVNGEGATL